MNLYYCLGFFVAGVISHIAIQSFLEARKVTKLFNEVNFYTITLLKYVYVESMANAQKAESFNDVKNVINAWVDASVGNYFKIYPSYLHRFIPFKTWEEAVRWQTSEAYKRS